MSNEERVPSCLMARLLPGKLDLMRLIRYSSGVRLNTATKDDVSKV